MSTVNITNAAMNFLGDGVRCPQCIEQGLTSRVDVLYTLSDAVHIPDYYDEDGNYHPAGRPPATTYCRCSNGHRFTFAS